MYSYIYSIISIFMAVALPPLPSYQIEGTSVGYGVIIINSFDEIPEMKREGVDLERESFENLFTSIGLKPILFNNLKKNDILTELKMISKDDDLENHSMIAIAISSHGVEKGLVGVNIQERLERMKNKEPLEGLDDIVTLEALKMIFNAKSCSMLKAKPKLILLNGWKEGSNEMSKADGGPAPLSTESSDFLSICSSYDSICPLLAGSTLPPSKFPSILCSNILKYKSTPLTTLMGVVNGELKKNSKAVVKLKGKNISICESCVSDTTLQLQLQLFK